jgi:hypothetical protein
MEARAKGCGGAPNLVQPRAGVDAAQLPAEVTPIPLRLRLGRLSIAQNQRLHLVDCVRMEERIGEVEKDFQFHGVVLVLTQRRRYQRVAQQLHPLLVAPLQNLHSSEPTARRALY